MQYSNQLIKKEKFLFLKKNQKAFCILTFYIFPLLVLISPLSKVYATDYYVSSSTGNDSYNGLAASYNGTSGPWNSLTKVSSFTFTAGDRIYLKTGDIWIGQTLLLKGLGTSANPIILSTYGTAARPVISPRITDAYGITIKNTGGWKIIGVEIEKARAGIALQFDNSYNNDYVFIDNCNIHDIDDTYNSNPNLYNHISSGILLEGNGSASPYHLTNLTVQNITFNNVNCSWWVGCISTYTNASGFGSNSRFKNITVNNMNATNGKQWGYSFLFLEDAVITNADCDNTGFGTNPYGACGTLVAYSQRVVLDGCDIYNSKRGPQPYDGVGFDFEGGVNTSDITFKNAIVDRSDGCGIFVFNNGGVGGTPNLLLENVTVSNFGLNPGNSSAGIDFSSAGNSSGIIRNNTIIRPNTSVAFYTGYPAIPANFTFTNNIFSEAGTLPPTALNISPNATVTASTTDVGNGYATSKANDNNTADFTGWASTVGSPQWLELTWASAQTIDKIELYTTNNYFLKDYDVQYWNGSGWITAASVRNNIQKQVNTVFTALSTIKLRIYCITPDQTSYCRIDEIKVYNTASSSVPALSNSGFETPATSTYQYGPFTNGWTFDSQTGVQKNGSPWGAATAPQGVQTCFIQKTGIITQALNFTTGGDYKITFQLAKRTGGNQTIEVYIDANKVGTFSPSSTVFSEVSTNNFTATAATHFIKFAGTISTDDVTAFVDKVSILSATIVASSNLALLKTYSSSSNWDANQTADKAFDGNQTTNWQAQTGTFANQWLTVDFGTGTTFNKVVLSEYGNRTSGFRIEYSTDGSTWLTAYTGTTIGSSNTITFSSVTGRYARIYFTSGSANAPIIYEFEVYNIGTPSRLAASTVKPRKVVSSLIGIYPNPTVEQLTINVPVKNNTWHYRLLSLQGAVLQKGVIKAISNQINMRGYSAGVYLLELKSSDGELIIRRLIKE